MEELNKFIEELKDNQKINTKNKLENRVDINYVIKRLEDIKVRMFVYEEAIYNEIEFQLESLMNEYEENGQDTSKLENLTKSDLSKINNLIQDDMELNDTLNDTVRWYITHYEKVVD